MYRVHVLAGIVALVSRSSNLLDAYLKLDLCGCVIALLLFASKGQWGFCTWADKKYTRVLLLLLA